MESERANSSTTAASRVGQLLQGPDAGSRLARLTREARRVMYNVRRVGQEPEDIVASVIATAMRREQLPDSKIPTSTDDQIWEWINKRLLETKRLKYRDQQRGDLHGWRMTSDLAGPIDSDAPSPESRVAQKATQAFSEEDLTAYIDYAFSLAKETRSPLLRRAAICIMQGYTFKETCEQLSITEHQLRDIRAELRDAWGAGHDDE